MIECEPETIVVKDAGLKFPNVRAICGLSLPAFIRYIEPVLREGGLTVIDGKVPGKQILEIYQTSESLRRVGKKRGGLPVRRKPVNIIFELSET